jgi:sugar lactone lactonase YvrE
MRLFSSDAVTEARAEHAEGPCWDPRAGQLLWVDQFAGLIHLADYEPGPGRLRLVRTYQAGAAVGAVVPVSEPGGGWMVACEAGFAHLAESGELRMLARPEAAASGRVRMNDGKCDPVGRFWAGSMAWDKSAGAGSLYRLNTDLSVDLVRAHVTISNGLAWTADGHHLFYIDTPTRRVDRFDARGDGILSGGSSVVVFAEHMGQPDGMCIDEEGCLWVALWGGSAVYRCSPDGEILARVDVDAPLVSSCCFGGPERTTLFITTSQEGMPPEWRALHPQSGRVFRAEVGIRGTVTDCFAGDPGAVDTGVAPTAS